MSQKINRILGAFLLTFLWAGACANEDKVPFHVPREATPPMDISLSTEFKFDMGIADDKEGVISKRYALAPTEVTYDLWFNVKMWAIVNGYTFNNQDREGSLGTPAAMPSGKKFHPVTHVNWYDAVVWCNAYTEWSNIYRGTSYTTVYNDADGTIRDVNKKSELNAITNPSGGTGFRLPTSAEWEFVARWQGSQKITNNTKEKDYDGKKYYFTKGDAAARASDTLNDNTATNEVCWNKASSGGQTSPVAKLQASVLGMYDISGNVAEWCFDEKGTPTLSTKVLRGGSFKDEPKYDKSAPPPLPALAIGVETLKETDTFAEDIGFRVARSL